MMQTPPSIDLITLELKKFLGNIPFSLRIESTQTKTAANIMINYRELESSMAQDLKELVYKDFSSYTKTLGTKTLGTKNPCLSVSHSCFQGDLTVAVIGSIHPIGIDLEHSQRKVHPQVLPRICTPDEIRFGLTVLEAWTIKEAAFKAFYQNKNTTLPSYKIASWNADQRDGVIQFPNYDFGRFYLTRWSSWFVAVAVSDTKLCP